MFSFSNSPRSPSSALHPLILFARSYHTQKPTRNTLLAVTSLQQLKLSVQRGKQRTVLYVTLYRVRFDMQIEYSTGKSSSSNANAPRIYKFGCSGWKASLWHPLVLEQCTCLLLNPSIYYILIDSKSGKTTEVCLTQNSMHCHKQWHGTEQFQQSKSHQSSAPRHHRAGGTAAQMFSMLSHSWLVLD